MSRVFFTTTIVLFVLVGCRQAAVEPPVAELPEPDPVHLAEVEQWRAERYERLRQPDGWLSLAGLYWLDEGDNVFGSASDNALVFPEGAPARMGVLTRAGTDVVFGSEVGVEVLNNGEPVADGTPLAADVTGEPTVLEYGSFSFYVIERGERVGVRLKDSASELLTSFDGIDHYPVDPAWRVAAEFVTYDEPREVMTPNIIGDDLPTKVTGVAVFEIDGAEYRLEGEGDPTDELFFVFGDQTNTDETYGGGRFLYAGPVEADGELVLDFNRSYNPPCVFTPYATCPLPRPQDKLALRIPAGEKKFSGSLGSAH